MSQWSSISKHAVHNAGHIMSIEMDKQTQRAAPTIEDVS